MSDTRYAALYICTVPKIKQAVIVCFSLAKNIGKTRIDLKRPGRHFKAFSVFSVSNDPGGFKTPVRFTPPWLFLSFLALRPEPPSPGQTPPGYLHRLIKLTLAVSIVRFL